MWNKNFNRKKGYDYSQSGWYFITFVTKYRIHWFGEILNNEMKINNLGKIVEECWYDLPNHYKNCRLDEFIVMPDHFHGIIVIDNFVNFVAYGIPETCAYGILETCAYGYRIGSKISCFT